RLSLSTSNCDCFAPLRSTRNDNHSNNQAIPKSSTPTSNYQTVIARNVHRKVFPKGSNPNVSHYQRVIAIATLRDRSAQLPCGYRYRPYGYALLTSRTKYIKYIFAHLEFSLTI
ncbi:MAG: hypothetical protein AAF378_17010, partial [Cyanobacteria bacterium P01_A01_bin.84]